MGLTNCNGLFWDCLPNETVKTILMIGCNNNSQYTINGYLSNNINCFRSYYTDLTHYVQCQKLWIDDNVICDKDLRRHGIGSAGLDCIKDLARQLGCKTISGKAQVPNMFDTEELEHLLAFYRKNGFVETDAQKHIVTYTL